MELVLKIAFQLLYCLSMNASDNILLFLRLVYNIHADGHIAYLELLREEV